MTVTKGLCVGYLAEIYNQGCKYEQIRSDPCFHINFLLPMSGAAAYSTLCRHPLAEILTPLKILAIVNCMKSVGGLLFEFG